VKLRVQLLLLATAAALVASGCAKKHVAATPPAPAAPAQSASAQSQAARPAPARPAERPRQTASTPARRMPDAATRARIDELLARIQDAYFDYNDHKLRPDALKTLESDATELRNIIVQYPDYGLTIEGYCDERGSEEYNLALGDARARAARDYLQGVGIPGTQLKTISYGKEKQLCTDHDEDCWQKNRRIHIVAAEKQG
jgi:peptidoglycan-associated lipoprotein